MNPGPTGRSRRENFTMRETVIGGTPSACIIMLAVRMCKIHPVSKGGHKTGASRRGNTGGRVVIVIIGSKASVSRFGQSSGNLIAQLLGFRGILPDLEPGEVRGTTGVGVKSCNHCGTTCGEGVLQNGFDR